MLGPVLGQQHNVSSKTSGLGHDCHGIPVVIGMDNVADNSLLKSTIIMSSMVDDQSFVMAAPAILAAVLCGLSSNHSCERAVKSPSKTRCSKSKPVAEGASR